MPLSKGALSIAGPFEGNGLEICRDLQGLMLRLSMERGIIGVDEATGPDQTGFRCTKHGPCSSGRCEKCEAESAQQQESKP